MAVECVGDVGIEAPPAVCFATAADIERWTEGARDLERVDVLARGGDGRLEQARMVADLFGKELDATVASPHAIGRAHDWTPVTVKSRMAAPACKIIDH